jgi:hypothetical protein
VAFYQAWRDARTRMRIILVGDDVPAARDVLRDMIGAIPCEPAPGGVFLTWATGQATIQTGTDKINDFVVPGHDSLPSINLIRSDRD